MLNQNAVIKKAFHAAKVQVSITPAERKMAARILVYQAFKVSF